MPSAGVIAERNALAHSSTDRTMVTSTTGYLCLYGRRLSDGGSRLSVFAGWYANGANLIGFYDQRHLHIDGENRRLVYRRYRQRFKASIPLACCQMCMTLTARSGSGEKATRSPELQKINLRQLSVGRQIGFGPRRIKPGRRSRTARRAGREEECGADSPQLGWHHPAFEIPKEIYRAWMAVKKARKAQQQWQEKVLPLGEKAYPRAGREFTSAPWMKAAIAGRMGIRHAKILLTTCRLTPAKNRHP